MYLRVKNKVVILWKNSKKSVFPIEDMREKVLKLCTCTSIEIMTAIGVTGYLWYLGDSILALISMVIFAKLIVFHFIMDYYDKKNSKKYLKTLSNPNN